MLATDFSEVSETPLRHAVAIARQFGAKLYLAHVVPFGFPRKRAPGLKAAMEAAWGHAHELESRLLQGGSLADLGYEFVIQHGVVWEVLNQLIRQEDADLIVSGTHARRGIRKVLLGSIAEQIFRDADCPVFTVGPKSRRQSRVGAASLTFLFPTDFGEASLQALPQAVCYANQFKAKLLLLHVLHTPSSPGTFLHQATVRMLEELTMNSAVKVGPEILVESSPAAPVSAKILQTAERWKVDLIIMGLRRSTYVEAASHAPWATAYEVVCGARCPVLTLRC